MQVQVSKYTLLCCTLAWCVGGTATAFADDAKKDVIEAEAVALGRPVDFEQDIYPILDANCIACHNLAIKENNLNLEDVENILKGGKRGPAVVAKDPEKSLLYLTVSRKAQPAMPPLPNKVEASALTPREVGLIKQWILEGATSSQSSGGGTIQWQSLPTNIQSSYALALSDDGQYVAASRGNRIGVYHIPSGAQIAQLEDPNLKSLEKDGKPMYGDHPTHRDFVHALAFSPDGSTIASAGYRVVKLWKRPANVQKLNVAASSAEVPAVAVSPDGKWLATGGADNTIKLINLADGSIAREIAGHTAGVTALQFTPDNAQLVSGSLDKTVRIWKVADGAAVASVETPAAVNAVALSADAKAVYTGGADNIIRQWTIAAGEGGAVTLTESKQLTGHGQPVTALALIPPANNQLLSGSADGTVRVWSLDNGSQVRSMNHGGPVTAVAVRADGQQFASASANNTAKLWNAANGQQVAEMKGDLRAQRKHAELVADDAEAKARVTATANAIKTAETDAKTKEEAAKKAAEAKAAAEKALTEATQKTKEATDKFNEAKAKFDEKTDDKNLEKAKNDAEKAKTDAEAAQKKAEDAKTAADKAFDLAEKASKDAVEAVAKAKADNEAAIALQKKLEEEVKAALAASTATEKPIRSIAYTADGKILATGGDDNLIHTWSSTDGQPLEIYTGHEGPVLALAFAPGHGLVSASADKSARVWDLLPAWTLAGQLGTKPEAPLDLSESPFVSRVLALDFSNDGKLLATGGGDPSRSGELMIWDVANLSLVRTVEDAHSDTVFGVEFSRDGKYLLSGAADKFVKIFEVETGKHVKSFEGHTHHVMDVTWKADGSSIASAGADNAIKVWNVETGEQSRTIQGYAKQVTSIQFMGRGINIASCGGDATVRFHRTDNGQNFRSFAGASDYMYAVAATADEKLVVAAGEDGVIRVWNGTNGQVIINFEPPKTAEQLAKEQASAK